MTRFSYQGNRETRCRHTLVLCLCYNMVYGHRNETMSALCVHYVRNLCRVD